MIVLYTLAGAALFLLALERVNVRRERDRQEFAVAMRDLELLERELDLEARELDLIEAGVIPTGNPGVFSGSTLN